MNILRRILHFLFYRSPADRWDSAASAMAFDGYTDLEIIQELGKRPADETTEG